MRGWSSFRGTAWLLQGPLPAGALIPAFCRAELVAVMLQLGNGQQLDFSWCHGFPSDGDRHYIASQGDSSLAGAVVREVYA